MLEVQAIHGEEWIQRCWTAFADGVHLGITFDTPEGFDVIHVLQTIGLEVNVAKTHILVAHHGASSKRIAAVSATGSKSKPAMQIPLPTGQVLHIPLAHQAVYLGVVMSYADYSRQTVDHRISASRNAFSRLHRWLTSKTLTPSTRLKVWMTCIRPILLYGGVFAIDLASSCVHVLQEEMYRQLRKVFRDHSFVTGRSHQAALTFHQSLLPLQLLHQGAEQIHRTVMQRHTCLPPFATLTGPACQT